METPIRTSGEASGGNDEPVIDLSGDGAVEVEPEQPAVIVTSRTTNFLDAQTSESANILSRGGAADDMAAGQKALAASLAALVDASKTVELQAKDFSDFLAAMRARRMAKRKAQAEEKEKAEIEANQKADLKAAQLAELVFARTRTLQIEFPSRQLPEFEAARQQEQPQVDLAEERQRANAMPPSQRTTTLIVLVNFLVLGIIIVAVIVVFDGHRRRTRKEHRSGEPK